MPNPPPVWDQYYSGGPHQQAADWNASQHSAIAQDPGTHAGPTGPTGPAPSSVASFRAIGPAGNYSGGSTMLLSFNTLQFQQGNYFNVNTYAWTPPAGKVFLYARCAVSNLAQETMCALYVYKNGSIISTTYKYLFSSGGSIDSIDISFLDLCSGADSYDIRFRPWIDAVVESDATNMTVFFGTLIL